MLWAIDHMIPFPGRLYPLRQLLSLAGLYFYRLIDFLHTSQELFSLVNAIYHTSDSVFVE